jgi:hypothetical protein
MVVFLCNFFYTNAQNFDFNQKCKTAYIEAISLKYKSAQTILDTEQREHPKNLIPIYLENYLDFLELFTSENKSRFLLLKQNQESRITQLQNGDKNSPYYLFTQAEIHIQWAVIKIKFGDYISAVLDIRKANKLLQENSLKYKDFKPNQKSVAMLQCLFGSIPDSYKWGGSLLGLSGNIEQGISTLNSLLVQNNSDYIYKDETLIIYSMIQFHLNNKQEEAWNILKKNNYPIAGNAMSYYITGYIGAYVGHSTAALKALEEMPRNNSIYIAAPIVDYLIGLCKLYSLDKTALINFDTFLKNNKGENYKKAVYQKIAWLSLINKGYDAYKADIAKVKDIGVEVIDADKQAQKEAVSGITPDIKLLKIRLLCDGGHYEKAKSLEQTIKEEDYVEARKKLEFLYRKARIYHLTKDINQAILDYKKVVDLGKDKPYYYAANAALNLAYIYEEQKNKAEAIKYYNLCLSMKDHEYVNSLSQKAIAGLNRLD